MMQRRVAPNYDIGQVGDFVYFQLCKEFVGSDKDNLPKADLPKLEDVAKAARGRYGFAHKDVYAGIKTMLERHPSEVSAFGYDIAKELATVEESMKKSLEECVSGSN